jgi:hypothetical protein
LKKIAGILSNDLGFILQQGFRGFLFLLCIVSFLGIAVWYRYFENPMFFFTEAHGHPLFRFSYYVVAYFGAVFLIAAFFRRHNQLVKAEFWIISFIILSALYLNHFHPIIPLQTFSIPSWSFFDKLLYNTQCTLLYSMAPLTGWWLYHKSKHPEWKIYGWNFSYKLLRPYFIMLLIMTPLLIWAAFRPDFQSAYPRYVPGRMEEYYGISPVLTVSVFETSYVTQFITLEWFFRGFMVLSLSRFFGIYAVWPMVAVYVFLHFGKPMHETIGSFFGGFILGTIALHTKSIWGGIIIHVGIALLIELLAFLI